MAAEIIEMSNDEALRRVEHGGTIIIMDVPPGTEFGIDCTIFTVGEKFRGVKMVPPGLHLVLLGAAGNDVTRVAEFVRVAPADVHVRRWDPHTETFARGTGHDPEQTARLQMGARRHDFDAATGAYPAQSAEVWHRLTSHVTEDVLSRCGVPVGTRVAPGDPDQPLEACVRGGPEAAAAARERGKTSAAASSGGSFATTDVPVAPSFGDAASRAPAGASPEEITALGHDPEARLRRAVAAAHGGDWRGFLGCNQTAFVLFLLLGSEPALAHWKATTALLCDAAVSCAAAFAPLYEAFTASFAAQLDRAAETLFEDEDLSPAFPSSEIKNKRGGQNFLRVALVALTGGLREALNDAFVENENETKNDGVSRKTVFETARRGRLLEKWALAKFGVDVAAERALHNEQERACNQ